MLSISEVFASPVANYRFAQLTRKRAFAPWTTARTKCGHSHSRCSTGSTA